MSEQRGLDGTQAYNVVYRVLIDKYTPMLQVNSSHKKCIKQH